MRHFPILFTLLLCSITAFGQSDRLYRTYGAEKPLEEQIASHHRLTAALIPRIVRTGDWEDITVPVVFHVLYNGERSRVSREQVMEQLEALNQDYSGKAEIPTRDDRDPDGAHAAAQTDTRIRFCFPQAGPEDDPDKFLTYRSVAYTEGSESDIKTDETGSAPLAPGRFLNIWVTSLEDNRAGYAQRPGGKPETDGIVIDPRYFGLSGTAVAPYDGGKTLTHLIGIYLGLSPIWGDSPCSDDGIADTPIHNGPNHGRPGLGHVSTCPGNPLEMTMNFMDSADDDQLYLFTKGQAAFMRAILGKDGLRGQLVANTTECSPLPPEDKQLKALSTENAEEDAVTLSIFPNPAEDHFTVRLSGPAEGSMLASLVIYDIKGVVVANRPALQGASRSDFFVSNWPPGVYFIHAVSTTGRTVLKRITLQ
jgi:hypothetical protein